MNPTAIASSPLRRFLARGVAASLCLAFFATAAWAVGPTSTLYITNYGEFAGGTKTGLDAIQGLSVQSTPVPLADLVGIDIAVYGDVRLMGYSGGDQGSRYDLASNSLPGGPYVNSIPMSQLHDGTTDGNFNYSVNYTTGDVLEFDRNWASPTVLFNATADIAGAGWITMNPADGSFWISQWGGLDQVSHFTHTGTLLSSFNSGIVGSVGLALDPIDGTLWMGDGTFTLHQFSQAGVALQSVTYAVQGSWYGMEFDTQVPEPSSWVLAGIALCAVVAAARRSR